MSFKKTTTPGKGATVDRITVDMARRIAQDVVERRDRMARKRKAAEAEIDDLVSDDLDDLDELEEEDDEEPDEIEDEDEDEDEEDPDEAPKRAKRGRKAKKGKTAKAKPQREGVGTAELAEAAGVEPRQLRAYLRSQEIQPRDDRDGRYWWPSLNDKQAKSIVKAVRGGAVDRMNKEKLDNLKSRKGKKTGTKRSSKKRARAKK